jgi:hypothetical protein
VDWGRAASLLDGRHGVLAVRDAPLLGMTEGDLRRAARRGNLERPARGVILAPGAPATFERAVMIAVAAVGDRVLVSRLAAAHLWGIVRTVPDVIELVVPFGRHVPDLSALAIEVRDRETVREVTVRVWRSRSLTRGDALDVAGIPLTAPARTVVDLAGATPLDALRSIVIDARQRRVLDLAALDAVHRRIVRYPGRPRVARVLADLDARTCDSRLEWDARDTMAEDGLTPHPRPFPYTCADGVTIEIDIAFPAAWVACECDGLGSRADRASLTTHHRRQNAAVADGWRPFLIDWTRLKDDPAGLIADLRALLATDPGRPPAPEADPRLVDARHRGRRG